MNARFLVGDVFERLAELPPASVDVIVSSPPFLAVRSYLPPDHPDKDKEIGSESMPADYLDALLDVTEACARVLAPHGSLCFELGDTYSGSGGAGGDYNPGGMRDGQPAFTGSANRARSPRHHQPDSKYGDGRDWEFERPHRAQKRDGMHPHPGWPPAKSLTFIPQLYGASLAYGRNLLRPERETPRWRVRNTVVWCRPNPVVGALSDKFRPATSTLTIATKTRDRYFDLDAVREPYSANSHPRLPQGAEARANNGKVSPDTNRATLAIINNTDTGAPPLDYWVISTQPYAGAHYAAFPPELVVRPIKAMCPHRVCRVCGEPSRRIVEAGGDYAEQLGESIGTFDRQNGASRSKERNADYAVARHAQYDTIGWTDCGHDDYRPGMVLDPFAGSGTVLAVATGHGRDAIGIDLDERNAALALERVGPLLLTVEP